MTNPGHSPDDAVELRSLLLDTAPDPDPSTSEAMFVATFSAGPGAEDTVSLLPTQDFLDAPAQDPDPEDAADPGDADPGAADPSAPELDGSPDGADADHGGDVTGYGDPDDHTHDAGHDISGPDDAGHGVSGYGDAGHDDGGDLGGIG